MNDLTTTAAEAKGLLPAAGTNAEWTERYTHAVMNTFGPPKRVLVRGEGVYVWDADGNRYLDLLAGIAVNALGHAHPTLTAAISAQLGTLGHISNFFASPTQVALAERLLALAWAPHGSRVFFANSGTEANEAVFKMARRTGRPRILALEGSFHGRSIGALAMTHKPAFRAPFEPLPGGVEFIPFGDVAALEEAMGDDVAAIVLEPIQGEIGVRSLPAGYLAAARELATRYGALLVLDEVQTGVGRTGEWFAHQLSPLGGGVVRVAFGEGPASLLGPGQHGSTFGGNPVAAAAALATLGVIERDGLLANVREVSYYLRTALTSSGNPLIAGVRGEGLLLAIELTAPVAPQVFQAALDAGFIVNAPTPDAVRLAPPLILSRAQAETFVAFMAGLTLPGSTLPGSTLPADPPEEARP